MRTPLETIQEFVDAFHAAWPKADAAAIATFFSDDAVYHNIPMEPIAGRASIEAALADMMAQLGGDIDLDMLHIVTDGPIVMTERVDHFIVGGKKISLPVMGIFEVHDELITAWRDYFDLNQFASQM